jgi:hypothetical protein
MKEIFEAFCSLTLRDAADYAAFAFAMTTWCAALWIIFGG